MTCPILRDGVILKRSGDGRKMTNKKWLFFLLPSIYGAQLIDDVFCHRRGERAHGELWCHRYNVFKQNQKCWLEFQFEMMRHKVCRNLHNESLLQIINQTNCWKLRINVIIIKILLFYFENCGWFVAKGYNREE